VWKEEVTPLAPQQRVPSMANKKKKTTKNILTESSKYKAIEIMTAVTKQKNKMWIQRTELTL
jgi:hypothetical protein